MSSTMYMISVRHSCAAIRYLAKSKRIYEMFKISRLKVSCIDFMTLKQLLHNNEIAFNCKNAEIYFRAHICAFNGQRYHCPTNSPKTVLVFQN